MILSDKEIFLAFVVTICVVSLIVSSDDLDYKSNSQAFAQTPSVPDAVTDVIATPGNGQVHLSWTAPDNNGSPIISSK